MSAVSSLSSGQLRHLRSLAHKLKPVVLLGKHGLSDNVLSEIDLALEHHELIKVKLAGVERDEKEALAQAICEPCRCHRVQLVGNMLTLFRQAGEPGKRRITLP